MREAYSLGRVAVARSSVLVVGHPQRLTCWLQVERRSSSPGTHGSSQRAYSGVAANSSAVAEPSVSRRYSRKTVMSSRT